MTELPIVCAMIFWFMLVGHALADYPLQTDFLAKGKNRHVNDGSTGVPWYYCMAAHSLVHGGAVSFIAAQVSTGLDVAVLLGVAETVIHFVIDVLKCEKIIGIHSDQFLHVACKVTWAAILTQLML